MVTRKRWGHISDQVLKPIRTTFFDDPELCACGCDHCAAQFRIPLMCARSECSGPPQLEQYAIDPDDRRPPRR